MSARGMPCGGAGPDIRRPTDDPRPRFFTIRGPWTPDPRPVRGRGGGTGISFREPPYSYVIRKGLPEFETSSNLTQTTTPDNPGRLRRLKFPSIRTYPGWSRITGYALGAGGRRFDPGRPDQTVARACEGSAPCGRTGERVGRMRPPSLA